MQYQIVLLFSIAVINSIFSYFVLRGDKSKTSVLFSLVALAVSLWSINLAFFITTPNLDNALFFANSYYLAAAAIPLFFFYFSLFFPERTALSWTTAKVLYLIPFLSILFAVSLDNNIILKSIYFDGNGKGVLINKGFYFLYGTYFVFFVILSYYHLSKSYLSSSEPVEKVQIKFILWGTALAYALGMTFNLFLPYFGNYSQIWLGPVFTIIMVFSIGYAILKHHLFDIKVIATELLTFALWFFILVRTLISETIQDQLINGVLFVATTILGALLIRSVIKEVEAREKIQKMALDLETANERLKELDGLKSEFLSLATHQIRSPLTAIKGYISLISEGSYGSIPESLKKPLNIVFQSTNNLVNLVEDFLNISRIEQGGMTYDKKETDFSKMIEEIVKELKPNIDDKGLALNTNIARNVLVNIDPLKFRQVIVNFIDNAIKYTPKGSVSVSLEAGKARARFCVKDSGVGIPKETIPHLFKKFSRADDASKFNVLGTGLGLYVAKEIVKAHDGEIWVESNGEGKGSAFYIEIPTAWGNAQKL